MPTSLFFSHNEALVPPYRVIVDTNFINLSLENRVDMVRAMMDVLYAKGASSLAANTRSSQLTRMGPTLVQPSLVSRIASSPNWRSWARSTVSLSGTAPPGLVNRALDSSC